MDSRADDVFFNLSDASSDSDEEKRPSGKTQEQSLEDDSARVEAFLKTIQPAYDKLKGTGKPLEYFKAERLIKKLATYGAAQKDQDAIEDFYFKMLEGCQNAIPSLKTLISTLKWLILAAESTEVEREYWLASIDKSIREIDVFETAHRQHIPEPQANAYRARLQTLSLNSELRDFYCSLQDVHENIEERRVAFNAASDLSPSSRESNGGLLQSLSPLTKHGAFSRPSFEMQRAASAGASETATPRRRLSYSRSVSE